MDLDRSWSRSATTSNCGDPGDADPGIPERTAGYGWRGVSLVRDEYARPRATRSPGRAASARVPASWPAARRRRRRTPTTSRADRPIRWPARADARSRCAARPAMSPARLQRRGPEPHARSPAAGSRSCRRRARAAIRGSRRPRTRRPVGYCVGHGRGLVSCHGFGNRGGDVGPAAAQQGDGRAYVHVDGDVRTRPRPLGTPSRHWVFAALREFCNFEVGMPSGAADPPEDRPSGGRGQSQEQGR